MANAGREWEGHGGSGCEVGALGRGQGPGREGGACRSRAGAEAVSRETEGWGRGDVPICLLHLGLGAEPVRRDVGVPAVLVFPTAEWTPLQGFPWHPDTPHPHPAWTKRARDRPLLPTLTP